MVSCVPTDNSLANPSIYTTVLHTLTCILVPLNLFGAYCILFKTPKKVEAVKWLMLNLQCLSLLLDFAISFLGAPYVVFPAVAGYPLGVFESVVQETYVFVSLFGAVSVSIVIVYENRYYVLFGVNTWWEKFRKPVLIFDHLLIPLFALPVVFTVPEQQSAYLEVSKILPCTPPKFIEDRELFVLAVEVRLAYICVAFMMICIGGQLIWFFNAILTKLILRTKRSSVISSRTNELQKKFAIALSLQTSIPIIVLLVPTIYLLMAVALQYHNQPFNNLAYCFFAVHGSLSTVIMLSVYQPYREFVISPLKRVKINTAKLSNANVQLSVIRHI